MTRPTFFNLKNATVPFSEDAGAVLVKLQEIMPLWPTSKHKWMVVYDNGDEYGAMRHRCTSRSYAANFAHGKKAHLFRATKDGRNWELSSF